MLNLLSIFLHYILNFSAIQSIFHFQHGTEPNNRIYATFDKEVGYLIS